MIPGAPWKIGLHVMQRIVHPAHVPFVVEAQSAVCGRIGHQGPSGRLLCDHHDVWMSFSDGFVDRADEGRCIEVLFGAVLVELLISGVIDAEVEIEHARDAVHADAVGMEHLDPEQRIGQQEAHDLGAAEIKFMRTPVRMDLAFVEHVAVERGQALGVRAEAPGNPVEDDADPGFVARFDEMHELLRRAVARGGGVVTRALVSP